MSYLWVVQGKKKKKKVSWLCDLLLTRSWWYFNRQHTSGSHYFTHRRTFFSIEKISRSVNIHYWEFSLPPPNPTQQPAESHLTAAAHICTAAAVTASSSPLRIGCCCRAPFLKRHTADGTHTSYVCNNWLDVYNKSNQIWLGFFFLSYYSGRRRRRGGGIKIWIDAFLSLSRCIDEANVF